MKRNVHIDEKNRNNKDFCDARTLQIVTLLKGKGTKFMYFSTANFYKTKNVL